MEPPASRRPRALYLCGWGRSGTTLVDLMVGQLPGFVSLGEVRSLWDADLHLHRCGCGATVARCPFWQPVLGQALGGGGAAQVEGMRRRRDAVARTRHLPRLAVAARARAPGAPALDYARAVAALYRAAAERAGASVVVDSSKHPADALVLAGSGAVELHVLHLVRDPRAVAFSWAAGPPGPARPGDPPARGALSTSAWWSVFNMAAGSLVRRAPGVRYTRLRYEDVVRAPARTLADVLRPLGGDPDRLPRGGPGGDRLDLAPSHLVAGNPLRLAAGPLTLRQDRRWAEEMATADRRLATMGALPLLARYGYPVRTGGR